MDDSKAESRSRVLRWFRALVWRDPVRLARILDELRVGIEDEDLVDVPRPISDEAPSSEET